MNGLRSLATFGYPIKSFETGREMETITVEASALHPPLPDIRVKHPRPQTQSNCGRHKVEVGCGLSFELNIKTLLGSRDANNTY